MGERKERKGMSASRYVECRRGKLATCHEVQVKKEFFPVGKGKKEHLSL